MIKNILLIIAVISSLNSFSQDFQWANSQPYASYVTWDSHVTTDNLGNTFISSQHQNGVLIVKYDHSGEQVWKKNYLGYGNITSLCTDNDGNLYATIMISGLTINGTLYAASGGEPNGYLFMKVDMQGNELWIKQINPAILLADKTDAQNNITVSGGFGYTTVFENGNTLTASSDFRKNFFMGKFNTNGECLWLIQEDGGRFAPLKEKDGFIYACDYFYGHITLGKGSKQVTLYESNGMGYIAKYDSVGELQWVKQVITCGIAVNSDGSLLSFEPNGSFPNAYLKKYDSNGNLLWTRTHILIGNWYKFAMQSGKNNDLYFTGGYSGFMTIDDTTISDSHARTFVAKVDSSGAFKWLISTAGSGSAGGKDLSVFNGNEIYITGDMSNSNSFGSYTTSQTNGGIYVAKISDLDITPVKEIPSFASSFDVFPNPSGSVFNVSYKGCSSEATINIKNQLGQIVYSKKYSNQSELKDSFNLSSQPKGIYFIELISDKSREVRKMVLQ
ncbi:MAG: T9SS type A sorting domain-containing protein [Bacteroidetes bacterium]|nr:T9SS type A sorting domain-containing protein [Bacteroidota bacterium]